MCLLGLAITVRTDEPRPKVHAGGLEAGSAGEVFGNYELLELLGEGGMGIVYKARQRNLNRVVALKMVRSGSFASASEIRRFRSEAQAAAQLAHPNVVAIHEVGEDNGQHFFSMEFVEGPSLAQVIRRTPLPAERAARYVRIIAEAIHYAHERGVLHRDLKPANVLIDGADQPRVTDFGLAKQLDPELRDGNTDPHASLTLSGAVVGTPSYMPPEQAQGRRKQIGPASDVYSLGAILYDCLTGRPPFRADTPVDTLRQVLDTEPAPPRLLNSKVPRDLETICLKCLNKEPCRRYSTAQELADELGRFLNQEPIKARPVNWVERTWQWCRRNPALAILLMAAFALMMLVTVAAVSAASILKSELRDQVLRANVYAAQGRASIMLWELERLSEPLVKTAREEPQLKEALQRGRSSDVLQGLLQKIFEKHNNPTNNYAMDGQSPFKSWYLLDRDGILVGLWPATNIIGQPFPYRDYFQRAKRITSKQTGRDAVVLSRVFKSKSDGLYKCGISTPIYAGEEFLGVLAATISLSSALGPDRLNDEQRKAVLVGPLEVPWPQDASSAPIAQSYTLFIHEGITTATNAVPVLKEQLRALPTQMRPGSIFQFPKSIPTQSSMNDHYEDPMGRHHPEYQGRWLAGFAPVGNTEWVVIVQQRYVESIKPVKDLLLRLGFWTGSALLFVVLAICGAAWLRSVRMARASG